jgi:thiosulfate/3-mercaptopyruvate sulfurtransferase
MDKDFETECLVSSSWLAANLTNSSIRIVEVSANKDPLSYFSGHIPGAIHWPWKESLWDSVSREFVSPRDFSRLMEKSGMGHDTTIIFYSSSAQFSHYAFWICLLRGHLKAKILHGNRLLWEKEKRPLVLEVPRVKPAAYPIRAPDENSRIGREGILAGLNKSDRVLLDVRSREEYIGERVSAKWNKVDHGAERKGHIPGALHYHYRELLKDNETFKSIAELRAGFAQRGATPDKEIVFYCRLSHRASLAWFAARYLLKYSRAKIYDGSWTEWGNLVGFPIENKSLLRPIPIPPLLAR